MTSSSPPSYSTFSPYNQPHSPHQHPKPSHPAFRSRKSSTIITVIQPSTVPDVAPAPMMQRTVSNDSAAAEQGEFVVNECVEEDEVILDTVVTKWHEGPVFVAGVKLAGLFVVFTAVLVATFYWGVPHVDDVDRPALKLPRSFADLQALNALFQKYKHLYPLRILACGVVTYLFVQTFSLPGSMYISILFGAAYGIFQGLLLSCLCESVGSVLCYTLSSLLAPPLLALPFYRARVETWRTKIMGDPAKGKKVGWDGVFAFLVVLRIAPFPPHWIANFVAPHLGIGVGLFWAACFVGIAPVSVIHVTIGSSLDSMTSAEDFHILSLRNILGLSAVIVAVLIPVGLKRVFSKDLGDLGEAEEDLVVSEAIQAEAEVETLHAIDSGVCLAPPSTGICGGGGGNIKGKGKLLPTLHDDEEYERREYVVPADGKTKLASAMTAGRFKGYGTMENEEEEVVEVKRGRWWLLGY